MMNVPDYTVYDAYGHPVPWPRLRLVPLPRRVSWWERHGETVMAVVIILVFVGYLGFQIVRAHVEGRL